MNAVCSLILQNDRVELARLAPFLDGVIARLGLNADTAHAVRLCVEEAVLNVVSHGFEPATQHEIRVAVWREDEAVHAEITDDGRPFDPRSYELPAPATDLQSAPIGGQGIRLMRNYAANITYRRAGSLNRLLLSFPP